MNVTGRKFNPGFLTDEELTASFCVRKAEFDSLVEMLRGCTSTSNPHQIVIGPRGSGKTILLLRVAAEVRQGPELSRRFFPVVFAEESYEVASTGEFWLEALSRLADQAPPGDDAPDLGLTCGDLRTIKDDQTLGERCLGALLDFADREDKRLVLMVENLNMIFRDMADRDAGWRLRKILQTEPRIILLASATSRFAEIDHPDHALYDLFRVSTLQPLDTEECARLWKTVSGQRPPGKTIRPMEILTGGNPRLVAIVAGFAAGRSFRELMDDLLDLVDEHTEYFKSHIEALPAQERRVYLALADLWKPATTREIAERSRIETSKCSAQLARLTERGVVQVTGGTLRRKQYYLTERLYNIYYLLRRNGGPDRLIRAFIKFMESYYSLPELKDIGVRIALEARTLDGEKRSLHRTAVEQLAKLPGMARHREELLALLSEEDEELDAARELLLRAVELQEQDPEESLATWDEVVRRFGESQSPEVFQLAALALFCKAEALGELGRPEEALAGYGEALVAYDEASRRFGGDDTEVDVEMVASALLKKGITLAQLERKEESLVAFQEVVGRFGECPSTEVHESVAAALFCKGVALGALNKPEEALAAYNEVGRRLGESGRELHLALLPITLFNKGVVLHQMNRPQEALAVYEEVIRQFEESDSADTLEMVAMALVNKGAALGELDRPEEELVSYEEMLRRFGESQTPDLLEAQAAALTYKGMALRDLNRFEESRAALQGVVERLRDSDSSELRGRAEDALLEIAELELESREYEAAGNAASQVIEDRGTQSHENRRRAHLIRAKATLRTGNPKRGAKDIQKVLQILPDGDSLPDIHHELMEFSIDVGAEAMIEIIQASPSAELLLPLTTALEQEIGRKPRVPKEVEEVAEDVRKHLALLRGLRSGEKNRRVT